MTCADLTCTRDRDGRRTALPALRRAAATLACWRRRAVERRQLAEMPDERWRDIARDPDAIRREIAKPFWRR
jgi:uncharacterized protein YjiS (DUF1127 family)